MKTPNVKTVDRFCLMVLIVVVVLCGYWLINQGIRQERLFREEKDSLTRQIQDTRLAEMNIQQLRVSTTAAADELSNLKKRIPEDAEIGTFLKQLNGLMKKRGVTLVSVQPQPIIKEPLYQKIPIRLSCTGPFVNLYYLLQDLDTMDRLVMTERLAIGKTEQPGHCQLDLTAVVFVRELQVSNVSR
jgi:Tfp pilus assembly protein PilO